MYSSVSLLLNVSVYIDIVSLLGGTVSKYGLAVEPGLNKSGGRREGGTKPASISNLDE
jgi:hypothetical protein